MLNQFNFCGYVVGDPFYYETNSKKNVCKFKVAIPRDYVNAQKIRPRDYIEMTAFGAAANFMSKYVKKGTLLSGVAEVSNNNYTKKSGEKVYGLLFKIKSLWKMRDSEQKEYTTITTPDGEDFPDFSDIDIGDIPDDMYCPF